MRQRLITRLDQAASAQLIQVIGPAGAGKSSLVASWVEGREVIWLRHAQHHLLLGEVLHHHGVHLETPDADSAISTLCERPADRPPAVLVLDDAHRSSGELVGVVTRLLSEIPLAAHFVLISNDELFTPQDLVDLGVSTMSLHGRDLRLCDEEAESLVLSVRPTIDDDELAAIVTQGRGWAAALVSGVVGGPTGELAAHVLATLPDGVGTTLLSTCDESVVDPSLAVTLTGDPAAVAHLLALSGDGLLVDRAAGAGEELFSVHPTLRRSLQEWSRVGEHGHETRVQAHARAAVALARDKSELASAVRHAILAEDPTLLRVLLRTHGHSLLEPSLHEHLWLALDALPVDVRGEDPAVLVLEAMLCRLSLRYDEAARLSVAAERFSGTLVDDGGDEGDALALDCIALMRLWRGRCGWTDPEWAVAEARKRLGCQHEIPGAAHRLGPGRSVVWSTWLMGELATVEIRLGDLTSAGVHLAELVHNGQILAHDRMLAAGLAHRSLLELVDGSFQTAASTALASLGHAVADGATNLPHLALAHVVAGWGALHELDLGACEEHLASAEREGAMEVDPLVGELSRLLSARLLAERGQVDDAARLLAQHRSSDQLAPAFLRRQTAMVEAQTAALVNDVSTLRDRALTLAGLDCHAESELFQAIADTRQGQLEGALDRIDEMLTRPGLDVLTGALAAAMRMGLLVRIGDLERARARMPDLLARVAPQRLMQILTICFVGGEAFAGLLADEARRPGGHPFALEAITSFGSYVSVPDQVSPRMRPVARRLRSIAGELAAADDQIALLTRREREVLLELANGGSYSDIARALFVSENTVKTHLTSVYRKLGVDRRGDALRIAREHHLI